MYLENRLIAMFDVLNFSSKIRDRKGLEGTIEFFRETVPELEGKVFISKASGEDNSGHDLPMIEVSRFVFDNLVLVSNQLAGDNRNVETFIHCLANTMSILAQQGFPLRGAFAFGDYAEDEETGVFLSNVFKELNAAEQWQNWVGCILLPDYQQVLLDQLNSAEIYNPTQQSILLPYTVKGKNREKECWCVNWVAGISDSALADIVKKLEPVRSKQINTSDFIKHIRTLPKVGCTLPPEFKPAVYVTVADTGIIGGYAFWDSEGERVEPGCSHFVHFARHGFIQDAFGGYEKESERIDLERAIEKRLAGNARKSES